MDAALSSRLDCAAGWLWHCNIFHSRDCARFLIEQRQASNPIPGRSEERFSKAHSRDCARFLIEQRQASNRNPGGATFSLRHSGESACGIPDGETLILTGGDGHTFVTRWEHRNSFSYGHEDANNDNPNTFEKQMCETAQKYAPDFDPFPSVPCTSKDCRYDVNGVVEELPQLPESIWAHACAALPTTGVRPDQHTC